MNSAHIRPKKPSFLTDARAVVVVGWPLILNNLFNIGVNVSDTLMVGRLGATQLAGLSIGSSLWIVTFLAGLGILMALGPTVSQHYGARRMLQIGRDTRQAVWLALGIAAIVAVVLNHVSPLLLWLDISSRCPRHRRHLAFRTPCLRTRPVLFAKT